MVPTPEAIGLFLCESTIVEAETKNLTLINIFLSFAVEAFPSEPTPFVAFAAVTGGTGRGMIELRVARLDSGEVIHSLKGQVDYDDRLGIHHALFRVNNLSFPEPGWYEFMLLIDGDPITRRRSRVYQTSGRSR